MNYLQDLGDAVVGEVLSRARERRSARELADDATWSSYHQVRALFEATRSVLGPDAMHCVGEASLTSAAVPELGDLLLGLGSPAALLGTLSLAAASMTTVVHSEATEVEPNHWQIVSRFGEGYEPFPEYCQFSAGLFSIIPRLYGLPTGHVVEE